MLNNIEKTEMTDSLLMANFEVATAAWLRFSEALAVGK